MTKYRRYSLLASCLKLKITLREINCPLILNKKIVLNNNIFELKHFKKQCSNYLICNNHNQTTNQRRKDWRDWASEASPIHSQQIPELCVHCTLYSMPVLVIRSFSASFSLRCFLFLFNWRSQRQDGKPINGKRHKRRKNKAKKERTAVHELSCREMVKSEYTTKALGSEPVYTNRQPVIAAFSTRGKVQYTPISVFPKFFIQLSHMPGATST